MAKLVIAKTFLASFGNLEKHTRQQVRSMIEKFQTDPNYGSLNREHYVKQADPRAQTLRVNDSMRAIILKAEQANAFILIDVLPHDKAVAWMHNTVSSVNPVTGALEICDVSVVTRAADAFEDPAATAGVDLFHDATDKDFRQLGVDEKFIPFVRRATSRAELDTLCALLPDLQGEAVTFLAEGLSVEAAYKELLDLIDGTAPSVKVEPDDIYAAATAPASSSNFHEVTGEAELDDILSKPFDLWRVYLHKSQQTMAERHFNGAARVLGGPGTGKTVVALHRAANLARKNPKARILFTTYTSTLATDLVSQLRTLAGSDTDGIVEIVNIDKLANRLVRESAPKTAPAPVSENDLNTLFADACNEVGLEHSPQFVRQEWEQIILAAAIDSRDAYFKVARPGRGVRLNRKERADVWEIIELVTSRLARKNKRSWLQIASDAADAVDAVGANGRARYDHILVDEAQDLHPAHWRLLRGLVANGPDDLFIVGDSQQRIYDRKVVLSRYDINVRGRSAVLRLNYRSTAEIVKWAVGVLGDGPSDDLDESTADKRAYRSIRAGATPHVAGFPSRMAEIEAVIDNVRSTIASGAQPDEIVVGCRTNDQAEMVLSKFNAAGVPARSLADDRSGEPDSVHVATFHRLKGLEYRHVYLVDVSEKTVPLPVAVTAASADQQQHDEDLARERSLLFVAATRARDTLQVSYNGKPSPFLP